MNAPLEALQNLIADSEAFQDWVGLGSANLAKAKTYRYEYPEATTLPFVIVSPPAETEGVFDFERKAVHAFAGQYIIQVDFWGLFNRDNTLATEFDTFMNAIGAIVQDILQMQGETVALGEALSISRGSWSSPQVTNEDEYKGSIIQDAVTCTGQIVSGWTVV